MSFEEIILIILFVSFFVIIFLLWRKIPLIAELTVPSTTKKTGLLFILRDGISKILELRHINFLLVAQKILSKIRILALKIERVIALWLQKLREKSRKKNVVEQDRYWSTLKEIKDESNKEKQK